MILTSCLLGNRVVSLCMKIINSVVVVGLYYGFLTAFSIGHSYLFLLRVQLIEKGTEKKVSATTGFIMGQLMLFISTYYAPLHLALSRPHTITVLAVPYVLSHFFWHINKDFFDYRSTTRNSMRNFSIQCVFLNNLIFPLFNHLTLPSSMLARLVNIYMFRCNNKMLFVTSGFVGWLIGHILFMKGLGLALVWIRQNRSIIWRWNRYLRYNKYLRSNKYLLYVKNFVLDVSELINSMAQIFSLLFLISSIYYLGRTPSPILTKKLQEPSKVEEGDEEEEEGDVEEEERDVKIETASEMKGTNQEQEGFTGKDPSPSFFSEEKADPNKIAETEDEFHFRFTETDSKNRPVSDSEESYLMNMNENHEFKIFDKKTENNDLFFFDEPLMTLLFDLNRWNRPLRYIKNEQIEGGVRNEMSQYFFDICQSDGKERISFTYPPSLSIFFEMIKTSISPHTLEKSSSNELDNPWVYTNKQKVKNFNNEFLNRIEALDKKKKSILLDILETRTRLCNDDSKKEYLSQRYDPFLNGSYRRTIYKSPSILKNFIETFGKNRIHGLLLSDTDYHEFEQKINGFEPLSTEIVTDANDEIISEEIISEEIFSEEMSQKVPRWSYKLITEVEQEADDYPEEAPDDHEIRTRKAKRVVIFTANAQDLDPTIVNPNASDEPEEVALIRYSQKSDFRRSVIKGSMRAQRRKMGVWLFYQPHAHSPLFLDRFRKFPFFYFDDISENLIFRIFRNWVRKGEAFKIVEYTEQEKKEEEKEKKRQSEEERVEIAEAWDDVTGGQAIRSFLLLSHSFSRKYILFPSFIIAKNIGRMLLLQRPEWSEDFQELNQEMHVKCTYNGVPLSETEFPKDWLLDGIQIKILFPFRLKPWHKSNLGSSEKNLIQNNKEDFGFLTVWGKEADRPFGSPRKQPSFFKPVLKELEKKIRQLQKHARIVFKGKPELFQQASKETNNWVIKSLIFITRIIKIIKELSKVNPIRLLRLKEVEVYESSEIKEEKDSIISNQIIHESFNQITSPSWKNSSVTEKKMKDLTDRTSTIRNQVERITKEKKKVTPRINNLSPNKTSYKAKRFEKWQILKRRAAELIAKLPLFFKSFIQRIYTDIFLSIMNIPRMNTELSLESTKKKSISNNEEEKMNNEEEKMNKKKKNPIFSTIKKALDYIRNSKMISHLFYELSCVSQAYVFYKLSHQLSNSYKSVLQHQGSPFFLKPEIKAPFETQGMGHSSYEMNHWKTCLRGLRGHYQYDLSRIRWSRLIPEKWRNRVRRIAKNENFSKSHSKDQLIHFKKQKQFEVDSLSNQKDNFQKNYRYDLLSYQFLNYENKRECCFYRSPFQGNTNQEISYKTAKLFDMLGNVPIKIKKFLGKIPYMEKTTDTKYFDWKILHFDLRKKVDIEAWIRIDSNRNQRKKFRTNNYEIIQQNDLFYLMIPDMIPEINPPNSNGFFDWMGMNEKMVKQPISRFFPEFVLLSNAYKTKPWFIPSQLLLLNLDRNQNSSSTEKEKINDKEKGSFLIASNHRNQEEKESTSRGDLESVLPQQKDIEENYEQKDIEENYERSDMKKRKKKKKKINTETELDLFLKHYSLFQLELDDSLNERMINNIRMYCFLLRLKDPRKVLLASVERRQLSLDIMRVEDFRQFVERGVLAIELGCLSGQKDGQFIMYQTIGTSLVHKSKDQTKYQEKRYVSKKHFDEAISAHDRISRNRDKNHFDLLVPENILSFRRRREFRIQISLNSKNRNDVDRNPVFWNGKNVKNSRQVSHDNNRLDREKNQFKLMKLKHFLWPNYRLEDLACMNRYWFDTNNGSRFSMLRIHLYPRLKIRG
uniref:Protein TIC 214 n=1 Tax=Dolichandra cynanchoides TaxID=353977 RepID=A0A2P1G9V6_9LAMI|nr:hypothetical chloroplast RF19 [Dolichandra cynanchoides]YP_009477273.1 hypothetical chloroplast RF19 [Dolichandra cynanchoides]AVM81733.1 hypothetical chloroplast RF19 [Dolichandra cynanchoides]AVM81734.1 hypothetical chloroplast RF19 [Dolichandra cynanchoides]